MLKMKGEGPRVLGGASENSRKSKGGLKGEKKHPAGVKTEV